jgi:hypothetical protein
MSLIKSKGFLKTRTASRALLFIATVLVMASLASLGIMQTNNAAAAGSTIFQDRFTGNAASAVKTIEEEGTEIIASALTSTSGEVQLCLLMIKYDASTDT